jgi:hypothetical protein
MLRSSVLVACVASSAAFAPQGALFSRYSANAAVSSLRSAKGASRVATAGRVGGLRMDLASHEVDATSFFSLDSNSSFDQKRNAILKSLVFPRMNLEHSFELYSSRSRMATQPQSIPLELASLRTRHPMKFSLSARTPSSTEL